MKTKFLFLLVFCFAFTSDTFSQTTVSGSFMYQSILRTYRIYIPAIYNSTVAVPLVLNLHGYSSNNTQQEAYGEFRPIADTANFIIVHPNGTLDPSNQRFWNAFDVMSPIDDVGFLSALIDTVSANYTIDPNRIYSTGMSNGGFMSYELACQLNNRIAAVASVTGGMVSSHMSTCSPIHPTPIMQIHGTADATVSYSGDAYIEPVDSLVKFWVEFNNCNPNPVMTNVPNVNTSDGCTAEHYVYSGGNLGATVELFKVIGGGHSWPGAIININVTNMDFNASVEIWRFFSQYRLNTLMPAGIDQNQPQPALPVYPNPAEEKFNLEFKDASERTVTITDCFGKVISVFTCSFDKTSFFIETPGIYFVTISDNEKVYTQKIIKL